MNSEAVRTYRHSGKFGVAGIILALAVGIGVGFPLGFAYAYLVRWIPFIYVNVLLTLGYGFLFGFLTARVLMLGKVRSNGLAALLGLVVGLLAEYFQWNGHVHAVLEDAPLFCRPDEIWYVIGLLYEHGSWSLRSGDNVTGPILAAVWVIEGLLIVGLAAWFARKPIAETPFCEKCQRWLNERRMLETLAPFTEAGEVAALRSGDLTPLLDAKPRTEEHALSFARLILKHSPVCDTFCTLRLENVAISIDRKGEKNEKVRPVTGDLVLPHSMFELIEKFASFEAPPPAAAGAQGESTGPPATGPSGTTGA